MRTSLVCSAAAALALGALAGCQQTERSTTSATKVTRVDPGDPQRPYEGAKENGGRSASGGSASGGSATGAGSTRESARRVAAPSGDTMARSMMAFPTGDRATSAVLLERMGPAEVVVGQPYTYEMKVTNISTMTLREVAVRDACTSNFAVAESVPAAQGKPPAEMSWTLGDLEPGASRTIKVTGKPTATGQITSCANVTYNSTLCLTTTAVQPALRVALSMQPEALLCDPAIMGSVKVSNAGTGTVRNAKFTIALPAGLTTADGKTSVAVDAGVLAAGQSRDFPLSLKASKTGQFAGKALAMADGELKAESSEAMVTVRQPALAIKSECPSAVLVGRNATVKFVVSNPSDTPAAATTVRATLPAGAAFVGADNNAVSTAGAVSWNLGTLEPKASRTLSLTVRSTGIGSVAVNAQAMATCATAVAANCSVGVQGTPDLGTLLTDRDGVVNVGDNHTYQYEAENQGQVDLTNVRAVITLPEGLDFVSATAPSAPKVEGRKLTFTLGTVKAGERRGFNIVVKVNKAGEYLTISETLAAEIKNPVRDDEVTVFIDR